MSGFSVQKYAKIKNKTKKKGIHLKSVELWFHIIIWCYPKWCHPKMVTPGADRPPPSDAAAYTDVQYLTYIDCV